MSIDLDPRSDRILVRSPERPAISSAQGSLEWTLQIGAIRIRNPAWTPSEPADPVAAVSWSPAPPGETADGLDLAAIAVAVPAGEGLAPIHSGTGRAEAHPDPYDPAAGHGEGHGGGHGRGHRDMSGGMPVTEGEHSLRSLDMVAPGTPIDGCGGLTAPGRPRALGPHREYYDSWNSAAWGEGDETLVHPGDGEGHVLDAGGGDDVVFLVAPGNGTELTASRPGQRADRAQPAGVWSRRRGNRARHRPGPAGNLAGHDSALHAGAGDDRITLFGLDTAVHPGPGADVVLFCGGGAGLTVSVVSPSDGAADIVVLADSVFAPTGLTGAPRRVTIAGLGDPGDRLVLHLPPGATVSDQRSHLLVAHDGQATGIWTAAAYPDFDSRLEWKGVILWP